LEVKILNLEVKKTNKAGDNIFWNFMNAVFQPKG
jgi:hypothetical protein